MKARSFRFLICVLYWSSGLRTMLSSSSRTLWNPKVIAMMFCEH